MNLKVQIAKNRDIRKRTTFLGGFDLEIFKNRKELNK